MMRVCVEVCVKERGGIEMRVLMCLKGICIVCVHVSSMCIRYIYIYEGVT